MAMVVYQGPPTAEQATSAGSSTALRLREPENTSAGLGGRRFVGLSNQGATCYLNGLLQTLYMTPEFRKAIFSWNYNSEKDGLEEWCIPLQLQRLFGMLQLSGATSIDTVSLTHSFGWEGTEVFQQQDVQELTRVLFDALEDSFRGTAVANIIDELYAGELIDYIRCLDVDYQSERRDKFLDFALAIVPFGSEVPMHSLSECIEMYLRPEILDGENQYFAEKYNRKSDAIKGLKFGKLPQIMSIQLKRFVYDWSGPSIVQKKLNDVVKFPMILDMNKYVSSKRTTRRSLGSKDKAAAADAVAATTAAEASNDATTDVATTDAAIAEAATVKEEINAEVFEEEEEVEEVNNEFEIFLRKQIERLKSSRGGTDESSCSDAVTTPASWSAASSAVQSNNRSPANGSDCNGEVGDKDEHVPEAAGKMSAVSEDASVVATAEAEVAPATTTTSTAATTATTTAVEESTTTPTERRNRADSTVEDADEGVIYDSLTADQIHHMLQTRGEWIYELYAVLIHSGAGIQYGHYYAYIKDLNSKQWWNFNDSNVTPVDERTVQDAWGAARNPPAYSSNYGTAVYSSVNNIYGGSFGGSSGLSKYSHSSNANAYMLMYRKINPATVAAAANTATATASGEVSEQKEPPPPLVSDDLVPQYIRDSVKAEEEARETKRREEEELRNRLKIRVYWQNEENFVPAHRLTTFQEFLKSIWQQFDLQTHLREIIPKHLRSKMLADLNAQRQQQQLQQMQQRDSVAVTAAAASTVDEVSSEKENAAPLESSGHSSKRKDQVELVDRMLSRSLVRRMSREATQHEDICTTTAVTPRASNVSNTAAAISKTSAAANASSTAAIDVAATSLDNSGTASTVSNSSVTTATAALDDATTDEIIVEFADEEEDLGVATADASNSSNVPPAQSTITTTATATTTDVVPAATVEEVEEITELSTEQENVLQALIASNEPCYDLFRLRSYNNYTQLKTDVFDIDNSGSMQLQDLQFNDYRSYIVETRSADEEWEVFYLDGISLLIVEFDRHSRTFKEPRNVRLKKAATLLDLKKYISKWVNYTADRVKVMKLTNYGFNDARLDVLSRDNARLREDLSIYEGFKLYCGETSPAVESSVATTAAASTAAAAVTDGAVVTSSSAAEGTKATEIAAATVAAVDDESLIFEAYLAQRNSIEIRYNAPPSLEFVKSLQVDARWTVQQLRAEFTSQLQLPEDEVRLFKQSLRGQELKDGFTSLAANGIYNGICIAVAQGKATPAGFYNILFVEYIAPDVRVGAIVLPELEQEVEEVSSATVMDDIDTSVAATATATALVVADGGGGRYSGDNFALQPMENATSVSAVAAAASSSCFHPTIATADPLDTIDLDAFTDDSPPSLIEVATVAVAVNGNNNKNNSSSSYSGIGSKQHTNFTASTAASKHSPLAVAANFQPGDYDYDSALETLSNQGVADVDENMNEEDTFYDGEDFPTTATCGGSEQAIMEAAGASFSNNSSGGNYYSGDIGNSNGDESDFLLQNRELGYHSSCTSTAGRNSPTEAAGFNSAGSAAYLDAAALENAAALATLDPPSAIYSSATNAAAAVTGAAGAVRMPEHPYAAMFDQSATATTGATAVATSSSCSNSSSSSSAAATTAAGDGCSSGGKSSSTAAAVDDVAVPTAAAARSYLSCDVEPSAFGQLMVRNTNPSSVYRTVEGLGGIFVQSSTSMQQLREMLVEKLVSLGRLPAGASPNRIRIRDKVGNSPGRIMTGDKSFQGNSVYLFDNKTLAFQLLEHGESDELPEFENGNVLVIVQQWLRSSWSLGERFEVLLRGNQTIRDISRGLSLLTDIPLQSMRAMVVPKETEFYLSELAQKSPSRNYGRSWFDPSQETRLLRFMSHEMRVQDGDVLLLQNADEPLMQLSPADLKSIAIVEAASSNSSTYLDFWSVSDAAEANNSSSNSGGSATTKTVKFGGSAAAAGITIKTYKDRLKEAEENGKSATTAAATDGNNSSSSSNSCSNGGSEAANEVSSDVAEFEKQGGMALFDDIV